MSASRSNGPKAPPSLSKASTVQPSTGGSTVRPPTTTSGQTAGGQTTGSQNTTASAQGGTALKNPVVDVNDLGDDPFQYGGQGSSSSINPGTILATTGFFLHAPKKK